MAERLRDFAGISEVDGFNTGQGSDLCPRTDLEWVVE